MKSSYVQQVRLTLSLFTKRDRRVIKRIIVLQTMFSVLDLLGVALIGVVGALAVRGVKSQEAGDRTSTLLKLIHLENFTLREQIIGIGAFAVATFVFKTLITLYFSRKILFFLNIKGASITADLFKRIMQQPIDGVNARPIQETIWILNSGVHNLTVGILTSAITIVSDTSLLLLLGVGLVIVDPLTTFITFGTFTILGLILYFVSHNRMQHFGIIRSNLDIQTNQQISQGLTSYREIFVKNRREFYGQKIEKARQTYAIADAEMRFIPTISKYAIELAIVFGALIVSVLQFNLNDSSRAVAMLALFIAASTRVAPAILRIQQGFVQLKGFVATSKPTFDLISSLSRVTSRKLNDSRDSQSHGPFLPTIQVTNLSFSYPNTQFEVLTGINLQLEVGKTLAIVGASGSGKSTLVDLLLGVLNPSSGEVLVSGVNPLVAIQEYAGEIAYVPQDVSITNGSVRENITIGYDSEEFSDDQIREAICIAQLDEFVSNTKEGIDAQVGDRGTSLSGGQRQRLGIARALLSKPQLLILDEATSSLDAESETRISQAIQTLKGRTSIVIVAHRLSTVRHADKIIYLDRGKIVGEGNFQELRKLIPEFDHQSKLMGL
jgi:ABC-type multidrug transport system fused ATPase/permease subunit